jgi:Domain of unknown function (DUF4365)
MPLKTIRKPGALASRKKRTRGHVIADLSANFVERLALLNGYSVECILKDYGYDMNILTFDEKGELENGMICIQLKATDCPRFVLNESQITCLLNKKDLDTWLREVYPVILIIYDAKKEKGYWVYIQKYFRSLPEFDLNLIKQSFTIRIPTDNVVDGLALQFRAYKSNILNQISNVISYQ